MKSLGARAAGERLERMQASPLWQGQDFRKLHPVLPGLRDSSGPRPTLGQFLCGGPRRVPPGPLPLVDPRPAWQQLPDSGCGRPGWAIPRCWWKSAGAAS